MSKVLLARAGFDGTLQLLTSGWERARGYGREEFRGKTLFQLMWSNHRQYDQHEHMMYIVAEETPENPAGSTS